MYTSPAESRWNDEFAMSYSNWHVASSVLSYKLLSAEVAYKRAIICLMYGRQMNIVLRRSCNLDPSTLNKVLNAPHDHICFWRVSYNPLSSVPGYYRIWSFERSITTKCILIGKLSHQSSVSCSYKVLIRLAILTFALFLALEDRVLIIDSILSRSPKLLEWKKPFTFPTSSLPGFRQGSILPEMLVGPLNQRIACSST